jgi:teichoic acid transport system permease protein
VASNTVTATPRPAAPTSYLGELWRRREFAWYLAMGKLRARNASTALGLLWWVLNPLLLAGVYFFAFGVVLGTQRGDPNYLAYLVAGLFVFHYTTQSMNAGAASILNSGKLLVNLKFPRMILPLSAIIEAGVGFLVSLVVFFALVIPLSDVRPTWSLAYVPPAFILQTLFNVGIAAFVARLAVPFRDIGNLLPFLTRLWLYLSPIIWPISMIDRAPVWAQTIMRANPMYWILEIYRGALLARPISYEAWIITGAWTLFALVFGVVLFVRQEGSMARYL